MAQTQSKYTRSGTPLPAPPLGPDEPPAGEQPHQPIKKKMGRPPKPEIPLTPEEEAKKYTDDEFFAWLRSIPASDWTEKLTLYLWRTQPFIDIGRKGEWRIEKFTQPVDPQHIKERHGSGGYKMILSKWDPVTSMTSMVRTHYFTIFDMDFPPRVPYGNWIDKAENSLWLCFKQQLQQQLQAPPGPASALADATAQGGLLKQVVEIVQELRPNQSAAEQTTLAQAVIQNMQESNKQMLALANPAQMVTLIKEILTERSGGNNELFTLLNGQLAALREELSDERKFNRELLGKIGEKPPAKSLKEELLELKEVGELIGFGARTARNTAAGGTDWAGVATEVAKEGFKTLGALGQLYMNRMASRAPAPSTRPPAPAQPNAPQLPAPADAQPQPHQEEANEMVQQISNQFGGLFDAATPFLVDHFTKGFSGMEFREWFVETYGTYTYNAIRGMSKETIAAVIELRKVQAPPHVAELLQQMQPPDRVLAFVEEFLSNLPADNEDDDTPGAADTAGAPGAPRAKEF